MYQLYQKNDLYFSLMWILIYVLGSSIIQNLTFSTTFMQICSMLFHGGLVLFLLKWIKDRSLNYLYGLCKIESSHQRYYYFIPLLMISTCNFWWGIKFPLFSIETISFIFSMIFVGILEELIFRGFLYHSLCKENERVAIMISSVTFGLGHFINLLNGADVLATIFQVVEACMIGLLFTIIYRKSGSLIPCILAHSFINASSVFQNINQVNSTNRLLASIIICLLAIIYLVLLKQKKDMIELSIERIQLHEQYLDALSLAYQKDGIACLKEEKYLAMYQALLDYLDHQWLSDYHRDEYGLLPHDLKRGVLSEDGLYNLIMELTQKNSE